MIRDKEGVAWSMVVDAEWMKVSVAIFKRQHLHHVRGRFRSIRISVEEEPGPERFLGIDKGALEHKQQLAPNHISSTLVTYHDCVPLISTRIAAQQSPAFLLVQVRILTITNQVLKAYFVASEVIDLLQPSGSIGVESVQNPRAIVDEGR